MARIFVLSRKHNLLPFAWRLVREGHEVDVAVLGRSRYERAWAGKFDNKWLHGRQKLADEENVQAVAEAVQEAGAFVLTDSARWTEGLGTAGVESLYGSLEPDPELPWAPAALGAWFDGEGFSGQHLLVQDVGLLPGGLGVGVPTGATLVRPQGWPDEFAEALGRSQDELKAARFRGLVQVPIQIHTSETGVTVEPQGLLAGWPWLHTHAWISDQPSVGRVLEGFVPEFPKRFTVAVTISVPPWPLPPGQRKPPEGAPLDIPRQVLGSCFFHDMRLEEGRPVVAGLDGLVAVVRGSGNQFELARQRALQVAGAFRVLPECQFRVDVGQQVPGMLVSAEMVGWNL